MLVSLVVLAELVIVLDFVEVILRLSVVLAVLLAVLEALYDNVVEMDELCVDVKLWLSLVLADVVATSDTALSVSQLAIILFKSFA